MGYSDAYPGGYGASSDLITSLLLETTTDVWQDLTDYLISGNVIRGRSVELDEFQAGTCEVVLDNDDRSFDPTYAASPLNGHILPMKRVRLLATYDGVQYPLFYGYADRWTQNREGPHRGTTTLSATDGFKVLARARLASSSYAQEVAEDNPVVWWRFDEGGGTVAFDTVGDNDLDQVEGDPQLGASTLVARDPGGALELAAGTDGFYREGTIPITGGPLTVEFVVNTTASTGTMVGAITFTGTYGFAFDGSDAIGFQVATAGGAANAPITVGWDDGTTHHVAAVWNADNSIKVYIDGVDRTSGTPSLAIASFPATLGWQIIGASPFDSGWTGTIDEVAIYNTALSPARIAAHAEAMSTPWDGDTTGERIERVLDHIGWPAGLRDIDTGGTVLQPAELDMTALEHAQRVAQTEFGNLYMTADGLVRFEARSASVNQTAQADFSDAAGSELPITFSAPEMSDEHIRNDVTVSRLDGSAQTVTDAASIAAYQISSYVRDGLYHDDDTYSRSMAEFILEAYKEPYERVSSMTVNPYHDPGTLFPAILGLELTDRITLTETPQWITPAVTRTLVVEGISHTFAAKAWEASFNLSEATAATQAYWALGVAGFSELGQTTRLFF